MIGYATIGTNDVARADAFFAPLLETPGISKIFDHPRGGVMYGKDGKLAFGVLTPFDRATASVGNGTMIAFDMPSRDEVDAFHAKALSLGAEDEGGPGERGPGFYMAYFRDLDGNKFCAYRIG